MYCLSIYIYTSFDIYIILNIYIIIYDTYVCNYIYIYVIYIYCIYAIYTICYLYTCYIYIYYLCVYIYTLYIYILQMGTLRGYSVNTPCSISRDCSPTPRWLKTPIK